MEQMCQYLQYQAPLRIWVLLTVLFLTLKGQDTAPVGWRRKSTKYSHTSQCCRYSCRWYTDLKMCPDAFPDTGLKWWKINIEQIVGSLAARGTSLETNATSVSSGSGSARSWNVLGHGDGLPATGFLGSHGQGWSDDSGKRGVDLTLSQALKMNMHGVPSYNNSHVNSTTLGLRFGSATSGINQTFWSKISQSASIAKQVPCQSDSYSKQEPHVRTLWPEKK